MAKTLSKEKILEGIKSLPLHDLLEVQRTTVETIAEQEREAEETIKKANEVLEQIRVGNGGGK